MYSNFWLKLAIPACAVGVAWCLVRGHAEMAGVYLMLLLIASGIDRQVGLDRNKSTPRGP